jgi:hypothetical protein
MNENQSPGEKQRPPAPAPQAAPGLVSAGSAFEKALAKLKTGHDLPDFQPTTTPPVEPPKPPLAPRRHIDWAVWLCVLALVGVGAWYFISNHLATVKEKNAAKIQHNKRRADIAALVLKYNAVNNWEASLPDRSAGTQPFSIDVSRALVGSNQQPVLVECFLDNIVEKDGKIFVSLSSVDPVNNLSFELQCYPDKLQTFTDAKSFSTFAVIARCHEVQRLTGDTDGFLVKGELLDVVQLP